MKAKTKGLKAQDRESRDSDIESVHLTEVEIDSDMEFELLRSDLTQQQTQEITGKGLKPNQQDRSSDSDGPSEKAPRKLAKEETAGISDNESDNEYYPAQRLRRFFMTLVLTKAQLMEAKMVLSEIEEQARLTNLDLIDVEDEKKEIEKENRELKEKLLVLEKQKSLEDKFNELSAKIDKIAEIKQSSGQETPVSKPLLYSEIIRANKNTRQIAKKTAIQHSKPVAAIYPVEGSNIQNSEGTKKALTECIDPTEQKIKIRNLRKIGNSGILIETDTAKDLEQVLANEKLKEKMRIGSLPKRKPKVIIFGVPSEASEAELLKAVIKQNLELVSEEKSDEEFKLLFRTGRKDKDVTNWVAEVSPETRKIRLGRNRIFVGFNAHGVKDFIAASRCFKCQAFGHVSKYCRSKIDTCGHCGKDGHVFKDCPSKKEKPTCINCKRAGKPANHGNREHSCPAYKHAIETCLSQIDFGNDVIK